MAKTIKFNLICDGYPVRTIDVLQEHFCVEDILKYYKCGLLQRWLSVRGYEKEYAAIKNMHGKDDASIIRELVHVFNVKTDADTIISKFEQEQLERQQRSGNQDATPNYEKLVETILENDKNLDVIKEKVQEINDKYQSSFNENYETLFETFYQYAPMALFVMITHENMRKRYFFLSYRCPKNIYYSKIKELTTPSSLRNILGENLKRYQETTYNNWVNLEPAGKKYLIFQMGFGDEVRAAGERQRKLSSSDVNFRYVILDGIDYCSKNPESTLFYMEV